MKPKPLARLGEVVRLTGAVARPCRGCGAPFLVAGKGGSALFCPACRVKTCPSCNARAGEHYAYCGWLKPHPCRGCGVELGHRRPGWYCEPCRAAKCPECQRHAGQHHVRCLFDRRRRRGLTAFYGVVPEAAIVALYVQHRREAIRMARQICGPDGEDVVQDVALFLVRQRDFLREVPSKKYFLTAVRHGALRRLLYAWNRTTVAVDPAMLVLIEQMTYDRTGATMAVPV